MDQQKIESLVPHFLWAEDLGVKCLDYKTRYCCSSVDMYRPQSITEFIRYIQPNVPIGPTVASVTWGPDGKKVDKVKLTVINPNTKGEIEGNNNTQPFTGSIIYSPDFVVNINGELSIE